MSHLGDNMQIIDGPRRVASASWTVSGPGFKGQGAIDILFLSC